MITEIPEKEAIAPAAAIAPKPSIPPQEKIPAVTSKIPEKRAFAKGEERFEKNTPLKTISKTPQAITIKAHILKQLSAAEIIDSTAQEALLFLGTEGKTKEFPGDFEKAEIIRAIKSEDKKCAEKIKNPVLKLPKTPIPTAKIRKEGAAFTQKQSIFAAIFLSRIPSMT